MVKDCVRIARPHHWIKNVFMLPGVFLGLMACGPRWDEVTTILLGMIAACVASSSNYVINEILDAPSDRAHPEKRFRPIPLGRVRPSVAYAEWIGLAAAALILAWLVNLYFLVSTAIFLIMGLLYNVPPVRMKDIPHIDVLSESLNNPIRLLLGWYSTQCTSMPPASLLLAYWMVGAFFMAVKRLAEIRHINDDAALLLYRESFRYYTTERLLTAVVFYTAAFGFFGGVFLIRYRTELILMSPFVSLMVAEYMRVGFKRNSPAQRPEALCKEGRLVVYVLLSVGAGVMAFLVRIPWLDELFRSTLPAGFH